MASEKMTSTAGMIADRALPLLTPLAVAYFGYMLSHSLDQAKLAMDSAKADSEIRSAEVASRVNKVKIISDFMEALSGLDALKRELAIKAILIALPDEGPDLVRTIALGRNAPAASPVGRVPTSTPVDTTPQAAAQDALAVRRDQLIAALFADAKPTRLSAFAAFQAGWSQDETVIQPLVAYALRNLANKSGVVNTLTFLKLAGFAPTRDSDAGRMIQDLAAKAHANGPETARLADETLARLRG